MNIIRQKVKMQEYEFAIPHFFEEMADDDIIFDDVLFAIKNGKVRRKFTKDPRGTRYEIAGNTLDNRKIAIVCRIKNTGKLLLITTYLLEGL